MTIVTAKWNLQEYHQMIETGLLDERKVELVSGEIDVARRCATLILQPA